jgi:hypothetical protein
MGATRVDLRQPTGRAQDVLPVEVLERRDVLVIGRRWSRRRIFSIRSCSRNA